MQVPAIMAKMRELRKLAAIPVKEIAKKVGVHHLTIYSWELQDHCPSLFDFTVWLDVIGYELVIRPKRPNA